jgi:hypothetical protein
MAITFVPGEPNKRANTVVQALWKNHHIIVYGSGNNLIIYTTSTTGESDSGSNFSKNLQTIYVEADPTAISINSENAFIALSFETKIIILKPLNEYMRYPQWTHALQFDNTTKINCICWAEKEHELAVGCEKNISLYHIYDDYGTLNYTQRWKCNQPSPITKIFITKNGSKIVALSGKFDRLVKVWLRINYGDENTLFEVSYLPHPKGTWITDIQWRLKSDIPSQSDGKVTDGAMANIKNIRGYIDTSNDDNDVIYTVTNDNIVRIWASYEYSSHSHIKLWATKDLKEAFDGKIHGIVIIENYYLEKSFIPSLKSSQVDELGTTNMMDFDVILVIGESGVVSMFSISRITHNPPNNIQIEKLMPASNLQMNKNTFPNIIHPQNQNQPEKSIHYLNSEEYEVTCKPLVFPKVSYLTNNENSPLSLIIHDRLKNSIRFNSLDFSCLNTLEEKKTVPFGTELLIKFQGQVKSVRKLIKSYSSHSKENIMLSVLNFYSHNFIWEPLYLNAVDSKPMTITKRFQICLEDIEENSILDAVIVNDIQHPSTTFRRHLVASIEKVGYISLWDCDSYTGDDLPAKLVKRLKIEDRDGTFIKNTPKSLLLTENKAVPCLYCIIGIFEFDFIRSWTINLKYNKTEIETIDFHEIKIESFPQNEKIHLIEKFNSVFNRDDRDLVSVIDINGILRIYTIDFALSNEKRLRWKQTHKVSTNIRNASKIHGSDVIDKIAVVDESRLNLSIWELKSGVLEYEEKFPDEYNAVRDLDWTYVHSSSSDLATNALLSVGFDRFVLLYTQLRYDYTNKIPPFAVIEKIDVSNYTSHKIGDLIWLDDCYLVIGCGNQFYIDDKWIRLGSSKNSSLDSVIRQLMIGYAKSNESTDEDYKPKQKTIYDISHIVGILNGPLPIYHPQFVIQALYMNQFKLVHKIFVDLFGAIRKGDPIIWDLNIDLEDEILRSDLDNLKDESSRNDTPATSLFEKSFDSLSSIDIFTKFNSSLADALNETLMKVSLPLMTRHQQSTLISIISITKDLKQISLSLDDNAIRFLLGFKLFQLSTKQTRLNMRDISWALHSDNKEVLFSAVEQHYKYKLKWEHIRATGLIYWIKSTRYIKLFEEAAKHEFSDTRDPSGIVSLFYLALRKKQILICLWKTISHTEQKKIVKFLSNDFNEQRWKSAALKNAFVLLGQHRYMDAAYFFLLGDSVKDCCSTLAGKVGDVPLAIAVSKVYWATDPKNERLDEVGPCLRSVIENYVLPDAISTGDRWTCSWIFWQLGFKELSIQALIKSPYEMMKRNSKMFSQLCNDNYILKVEQTHKGQSFLKDDPVLILLFNNLRQNKLNYLQGSLHITQLEEFNFIIKVCMIYSRMGCDYLAIMLLRNWNFIEIDIESKLEWKDKIKELENGEFKRRMSIIDVNSLPSPVRRASLIRRNSIIDNPPKDESKTAVKQSKPPPPPTAFEEPDMSSFSFGF